MSMILVISTIYLQVVSNCAKIGEVLLISCCLDSYVCTRALSLLICPRNSLGATMCVEPEREKERKREREREHEGGRKITKHDYMWFFKRRGQACKDTHSPRTTSQSVVALETS